MNPIDTSFLTGMIAGVAGGISLGYLAAAVSYAVADDRPAISPEAEEALGE